MKAILQRYEQLVQRGILAREQRDTAKATVDALAATLASGRAAIESAEVQLQYATIRAPNQRPHRGPHGHRGLVLSMPS